MATALGHTAPGWAATHLGVQCGGWCGTGSAQLRTTLQTSSSSGRGNSRAWGSRTDLQQMGLSGAGAEGQLGVRGAAHTWEDTLEVPGGQAIEDSVQQQQPHGRSEAVRVSWHGAGTQVVPLDAHPLLLVEGEVIAAEAKGHRGQQALGTARTAAWAKIGLGDEPKAPHPEHRGIAEGQLRALTTRTRIGKVM